MKDKPASVINRRGFIRQAACAALGTGALSAAIGDLHFINSAVAQSAINDCKVLVCIFLSGGNDSNNLVIPTIQAEYDDYAAIRSDALAIPISGAPSNNLAIPLSSLNSDGHNYGLHPACPELATLFGEGKLAVLFNTGTLVFPMTRAQYRAGVLQNPPQLFSHSDQPKWKFTPPDPTTRCGPRRPRDQVIALKQPPVANHPFAASRLEHRAVAAFLGRMQLNSPQRALFPNPKRSRGINSTCAVW